MKKSIFHFSFLIPAICFLLHQLIQKGFNIHIAYIDYYLDPFCLSALSLPLLAIERKWLFRNASFQLLDIVIALTVIIIVSEIILPLVSNKFVANPLDMLFIVLGGLWFVLLHPDSEYSIKSSKLSK